jgi:hypothetical protein
MLKFTTRGNFIDFIYVEDVIEHRFREHTIISLHNTSKCIDWSLPEDTSLISFTIDELKYTDIPITSIYFDGVVMTTQDDFETGVVAMFPGLAGDGGGGSSYLSYVALLSARIPGTQTSGSLIPGEWYKITTYADGDDFSNVANVSVGTINNQDCIFMATGTTPTDYTNGSELTSYGCPFVVSTNSDGDLSPLVDTIENVYWVRVSEGNYLGFKNIDGNDLTGITPDNLSSIYAKMATAFPYYKTYPNYNINLTEGYDSENFANIGAEITDVNLANKVLILQSMSSIVPFNRTDGFNNMGVSVQVYP